MGGKYEQRKIRSICIRRDHVNDHVFDVVRNGYRPDRQSSGIYNRTKRKRHDLADIGLSEARGGAHGQYASGPNSGNAQGAEKTDVDGRAHTWSEGKRGRHLRRTEPT